MTRFGLFTPKKKRKKNTAVLKVVYVRRYLKDTFPVMDDNRTYLPPEWNDEERIRTLMGPMPIPQDSVARTARLTFWTAALHQWCRSEKKLTFTLQECLSAFRRGTQQPLCLPDILLHMNSQGQAVLLDELPLGEREEETWIAWGRRLFISTPTRFAWKKVKQVLGVDNIQSKVFVDTQLLQEMCDTTLNIYWESSLNSDMGADNNPVSFASLYSKVGHCVGSADNLHLVIETLAYNGRASVIIHNDTTYVKIAKPGDTQKPCITQMEVAVTDLCCSQKNIENNITRLDSEISILQQEIMSLLKAKSKSKALSLLRRRKRAEKSLETQMGLLESVTSCLLQLQETKVNKDVLSAFEVGVHAIRTAVSGDGSADNAASTMDELQQVLEECQDISSLLSTGVNSTSQSLDIDDDALADELAQLVEGNQGLDKTETIRAGNMEGVQLPDVPRDNPMEHVREYASPLSSP